MYPDRPPIDLVATHHRRKILQSSALGFGAIALRALLAETEPPLGNNATLRAQDNLDSHPLLPKTPHFAPRAKRLVFMFMKGGPSHIDTFDPKPL